MNPKFATKVSFITVCKRWVVSTQLFCWHQHWGSLQGVTQKLDLDQRSMAHKHTERHKCDKTYFSVRPHDFLHPSPIKSALYVVIMFVLVCLCRFLWQIILLTYMSYELVAHFDLSLYLFLGGFWISSHYCLTVYHLKIWTNSVNIVLFNSTHMLLKCM